MLEQAALKVEGAAELTLAGTATAAAASAVLDVLLQLTAQALHADS